jgi:hypothetical protein
MPKDQFPKKFDAEQGVLKIESDDRLVAGVYLTSPSNGAMLSQLSTFEFISMLAAKAGLAASENPNGELVISRPENNLVKARRQDLANKFGDRPFAELDYVAKALINHILDDEVAGGRHKEKPGKLTK